MFKWFNPRVQLLEQRVKDLELANERLITQNSDNLNLLYSVREEKNKLQDLLYKQAGIIQSEITVRQSIRQEPISIGNKHRDWAQQKQNLESQALTVWKAKEAERIQKEIQDAENKINLKVETPEELQ